MEYNHTQKSPLGWILAATGVMIILVPNSIAFETTPFLISSGVGFIVIFFGFCFSNLTVSDEHLYLNVSYGPVPLFGTKVPYDSITDVEAARTSVLDGWGIHYSLTRGAVYNLWGFDCVKIQTGKKAVRIGTDDPEGLARFLKTKIPSRE